MLWLYDLPYGLFGLLTVTIFALFGVAGMFLTRRWVARLHTHGSNNDIVAAYFGAIVVLYGITLGLLMVDVWTAFSEAQTKVDREAASVAALWRDVSDLPDPERALLQIDLRRYVRGVIDVGWPLQQKGIVPHNAQGDLDDIGRHLLSFEPRTEAEKILLGEGFRLYYELVEWRRSRHVSVASGLAAPLWVLVAVGAIISIAVTWAFGMENRRLHLLMTVLVSILIGTMVYLVADMDHPFMGKISVSSDPFEIVYDTLMK